MALRGVNLGGWLVLERWMTPSLFEGTDATDEYSLSEAGMQDRIREHHRTFIREADFAWIAGHGIEVVRIPVGFWIFGDETPYVGGIEYVDAAFGWAAKHNIQVLLDLHGAPGSQNGWDHSGHSGKMEWHKKRQHPQKSLEVITKLAERYGKNQQLYGIEILNEPHWNIPKKVVANYYEDAYRIIRDHAPETVAVVISDAFRPYDWEDVLPQPEFKNVILDHHFYQCFDPADKKLDMPGHLQKAGHEWRDTINQLQTTKPVIAGEWSLALDGPVTDDERKAYAEAQLSTFTHTAAWFFWSYKTEGSNEWSLRSSAEILGLHS